MKSLTMQSMRKSNQGVVFTTGLGIKYNEYGRYCNFSYEGKFDLALPVEADQIEMVSFINTVMQDGVKGYVLQATWENPVIKGLDTPMTNSIRMGIGYRILLTFLMVESTRNIWLNFPEVPHSLLSYLRNRAIVTPMLLKYKVAILTCMLKGYSLNDISKIEREFERVGLNRQNYIFYIMFVLEQHAAKIDFDDQDVFVLTVEDMKHEADEFVMLDSTIRYARGHTAKKLSFIVKSAKMKPEDMHNELLVATRTAFTTVRPFKSLAYSQNYANRAMTNMVTRIIHAHTHYEENIRIVSTNEGYESTHVQLTEDVANFDASYTALDSSVNFNEDAMLEFLDAKNQQRKLKVAA